MQQIDKNNSIPFFPFVSSIYWKINWDSILWKSGKKNWILCIGRKKIFLWLGLVRLNEAVECSARVEGTRVGKTKPVERFCSGKSSNGLKDFILCRFFGSVHSCRADDHRFLEMAFNLAVEDLASLFFLLLYHRFVLSICCNYLLADL